MSSDAPPPAPALDDALRADQDRVLTTLLGMQRQSWEQGVTGHALLDLGRHDLVRALARDAVTRQTPAGKLAEIEDTGTVNCAAAAEAVRWVAETDDDPALADAFERQLRYLRQTCPRADDGTLFHLEHSPEVWTDSVYMVLPLLALTGDVTEAERQLRGHQRRLYDPGSGLWAARWHEERSERNGPQHWGTGNGWVAAGIARTLRILGPNAGDFGAEAAEHARGVVDSCLRHRRDDGLFTDVVDDPGTFSEANLAQMLAYACLTGAADGWLPSDYAATGRSLLAAARSRMDRQGFVTGVCGAPHFDRSGTSAEAQAFFLLASAARQRTGEQEQEGR